MILLSIPNLQLRAIITLDYWRNDNISTFNKVGFYLFIRIPKFTPLNSTIHNVATHCISISVVSPEFFWAGNAPPT